VRVVLAELVQRLQLQEHLQHMLVVEAVVVMEPLVALVAQVVVAQVVLALEPQ